MATGKTSVCSPETWRLIVFCLFVTCAASAYITFRGILGAMDADEVTFSARAGAVALGVAIWVMLYLLWSLTFTFVPTAGRLRLPAFGVVALICLLVLCMSTWLGAAGIAGSAAQTHHLKLSLKGFEAALDDRLARMGRLESLPPVLTEAGENYRRLAENEDRTGSITGTPGPGAVVRALTRVGGELTGLARTIRSLTGSAPAIAEAARTDLAAMRDALDSRDGDAVRQRTFADHANRLRGRMIALDIDGAVASVARTVASLEEVAQNQAVSSRSASLAAAQRSALEKLAGQLRASATGIHALLDDIAKGDPLVAPSPDTVTPTEAVFRYWSAFAPFWAAAIGLDFSALAVLLFLCIAQRQRETAEPVSPDVGALRVDDLLMAELARLRLADVRPKPPEELPTRRRGRPRKEAS